jgi:hypothetical protein
MSVQINKQEVRESLTVTLPRSYLKRMFNGTCLLVQSGIKTRLKHCNTHVSHVSLVAVSIPVTIDASRFNSRPFKRHCFNCRLNAASNEM